MAETRDRTALFHEGARIDKRIGRWMWLHAACRPAEHAFLVVASLALGFGVGAASLATLDVFAAAAFSATAVCLLRQLSFWRARRELEALDDILKKLGEP